MSRQGWRQGLGGGGDVPGGAMGGGWRGPARDLGAPAPRTLFPRRSRELPSRHTQRRVLVRCRARPGLFGMCPRCPPARGKGAGQGDKGSRAPCLAPAQLMCPWVTGVAQPSHGGCPGVTSLPCPGVTSLLCHGVMSLLCPGGDVPAMPWGDIPAVPRGDIPAVPWGRCPCRAPGVTSLPCPRSSHHSPGAASLFLTAFSPILRAT